MNDTVFEITEILNATLSFPGGIAPPRASIVQETTQITILDDECEWIYHACSSVSECSWLSEARSMVSI